MTDIHPTAIVDPKAVLGSGVKVGAYSVIGADVTLDDNVVIESHVVVGGITRIGSHTHVFPFASLGLSPQDLKYGGEKSQLYIGQHTVIREHVTMNPGTAGDAMITRVGDHCLFMVGSHVAHDCQVGNRVILANNATLAGHVHVGDHAIIGGLSAIHQFVRVGKHAIIGGMSGVEHDVIPYGSVIGERAGLAGLNLTGLKRRNFSRDSIHALRSAFKVIFLENGDTFERRVMKAKEQYGTVNEVNDVLEFLSADSSRAICRPRQSEGASRDVA